jgi:hypothetical protein
MSATKTVVLRAFNTQLFEFLDVVISFFPDREELRTTKTSAEMMKKANPTILIKGWLTYFYSKYAAAINSGNLDFFIEKNYEAEVQEISSSGAVGASEFLNFINEIREPVRLMSPEQKQVVVQYVQNLSRMSVQYAM